MQESETALAIAGTTLGSKECGIILSFEISGTRADNAKAAEIFILLVIFEAPISRAPLKTPGNAKTLFI